jgi:hypothetical protein
MLHELQTQKSLLERLSPRKDTISPDEDGIIVRHQRFELSPELWGAGKCESSEGNSRAQADNSLWNGPGQHFLIGAAHSRRSGRMSVDDCLNLWTGLIDSEVDGELRKRLPLTGDFFSSSIDFDEIVFRKICLGTRSRCDRKSTCLEPHAEVAIVIGHPAFLVHPVRVTNDS